jgi:hypothetical protein
VADIINLRQVRKRKTRAAHAETAAENRAKHGRTKGERTRTAAEAERERRDLDQKKLTRDE